MFQRKFIDSKRSLALYASYTSKDTNEHTYIILRTRKGVMYGGDDVARGFSLPNAFFSTTRRLTQTSVWAGHVVITTNISTNIMFLDISHRPVCSTKHNVSETGFCLRLHLKPTQLGPIDRASPYLRTPVPAPRWGIQAKYSTNHLRKLRKHSIIKTPHV
jgi:hypothetical protein